MHTAQMPVAYQYTYHILYTVNVVKETFQNIKLEHIGGPALEEVFLGCCFFLAMWTQKKMQADTKHIIYSKNI